MKIKKPCNNSRYGIVPLTTILPIPHNISFSKQYEHLHKNHTKEIEEEFQKTFEILLKELLNVEKVLQMDVNVHENILMEIKNESNLPEERDNSLWLQNDTKYLLRVHFRHLRKIIDNITKHASLLGSLLNFLLNELIECTENVLNEQQTTNETKTKHVTTPRIDIQKEDEKSIEKNVMKETKSRRKVKCTDNKYRERRARNVAIPPSNVPKELALYLEVDPIEINAETCANTIVDDERTGAERKKCTVVCFPMENPNLCIEQINLIQRWKRTVMDVKLKMEGISNESTEAAEANIYTKRLQYYDYIFHEASRLIHTKCPITACLAYGLWKSISKIAQYTKNYVLEDINIVRLAVVDMENDLNAVHRLIANEEDREKRIKQQFMLHLQRNKALQKEIFILEGRLKKMITIDARLYGDLLAFAEEYYGFIQNLLAWEPPDHDMIVDFSPMHYVNELRGLLFLKDEETNRKHEEIFAPKQEKQISEVLMVGTSEAALIENESSIIKEYELLRVADLLERLKSSREVTEPAQISRDSLRGANQKMDEVLFHAETAMHFNWKRHSSSSTQTTDSYLSNIHLSSEFLNVPTKRLPVTEEPFIADTSGARRTALRRIVPSSLVPFIHILPFDYTPEILPLTIIDELISLFVDWMFVYRFETATAATEFNPANEKIGYYLHQCALSYFSVPVYANSRLLDFVTSLHYFDTKNFKIHFFSRALHLPGVQPLHASAFWVVITYIRLLLLFAPNCSFYIDRYGTECIQESIAREALMQQFQSYPADILARLKTRISTYAETIGTIWIPAYGIAEIILTEYELYYENAMKDIESHLLKAEAEYNSVWNYGNFQSVMEMIMPEINKYLVAKLFRQILTESKGRIEKLDFSLCSRICMEYGMTSFYYSALFSKTRMIESKLSTLHYISDTLFDGILKHLWKTEKHRIAKKIDDNYRSMLGDINKERITGLIGLHEEMNRKIEIENVNMAEERKRLFQDLILQTYSNELNVCRLD